MVDVMGGPKSPWNVSAGRVFTDYLIEKTGRDDTPEMQKVVEKAFTNRVKSLKSHWKRDLLSQTAKAAEQSKHSRKQRKYQVQYVFITVTLGMLYTIIYGVVISTSP